MLGVNEQGTGLSNWERRMTTAKRVLLVDDDEMLRTSLAEQLASGGAYVPVHAAKHHRRQGKSAGRTLRIHGARRRPARRRRPRPVPGTARRRNHLPDHHAHRIGFRHRYHRGPEIRRQRLHHQAVPLCRADGACGCTSAQPRIERRGRLSHRPLHLPAKCEAFARRAKAHPR